MIYFISDFHFNHKNIIQYSNRPFEDLEIMENELINNYNSIVTNEDIVYFLGDFSMGKHFKSNDGRILKELNGTKYMILGNHDFNFKTINDIGLPEKINKINAQKYWRDVGFTDVFINPIILENYYILSHGPILGLNETQIFANIHGHTHTVSLNAKNYVNVCVEVTDYKPISFDKIKEKFEGDLNEN